ncbi:MAG TPA: phosphatase PAP2 family protein [Vicinamibacteria bacterium]|nr:phosphatase PAP2 family protein [Vicinamibacteria bacterium]
MPPLPRLSRIRAAVVVLTERLGPRLALGLLAAAGVALLLAGLADEVRDGEVQPLDDAVHSVLRDVSSPRATEVLRVLTDLGSGWVLTPATIVCAFGFLARRRIRGAVLLSVTMLGVAALDWMLKLTFARDRPSPFFGDAVPDSYSFPSGHALAAFCFWGVLAALLAVRVRSRAVRVVIWTAAAVVILAVGFSRVYLGVHYATDVVAGFGVGFIWVLTVASADRMLRGGDRAGARGAPAAEPPPA